MVSDIYQYNMNTWEIDLFSFLIDFNMLMKPPSHFSHKKQIKLHLIVEEDLV